MFCFSNSLESNQPKKDNHVWNFVVQTYNITSLCDEEYTVEPGSLRFLVEHGFDFNKQYSQGLSYYRGADQGADKVGLNLLLLEHKK